MCVKHQVSNIPILLYFFQVPWPPGNHVCSLYQNFSLQLAFPPHNSYTLCVSDNTLVKVIHKHNIRTALLPLLAWSFQKLFWTFIISLPAFSPNPSNSSSRYPCVNDGPSTKVSALLEFYYNKSATVALYNDWLQNAQAVFNYTEHASVYDWWLGTCASSIINYP